MTAHATLSARPQKRFWGWGYVHEQLSAQEHSVVQALLAGCLEGSARK